MMAFVVDAFGFLFELGFSAIADLVIGLFNFSDVRVVKERNKPHSDFGYAPGIVGLAVFILLLISGLWFSYLHP